eukprot:UC4_evm2s1290
MAEAPKRRTFKKYTYRGLDLEQLLDKSEEEMKQMYRCRVRRHMNRWDLESQKRKINRKKFVNVSISSSHPRCTCTFSPCDSLVCSSSGLTVFASCLPQKLYKAKKAAAGSEDKPQTKKTHMRNLVIQPYMIGSVAGVHNGTSIFTTVELKPEMIGMYTGEFALTYKPVKHGRPGLGATNSGRFIPLK